MKKPIKRYGRKSKVKHTQKMTKKTPNLKLTPTRKTEHKSTK